MGSDGLRDTNVDSRQLKFDPTLYSDLELYNQPNKALAGYNPNEEHGLIAPSFFHSEVVPKPNAAFALRNDLNRVDNNKSDYTSKPYVLVQYKEKATGKWHMNSYKVEIRDTNTTDHHRNYVLGSRTDDSFKYDFEYPMYVGDKVVAPYPLNTVIGANSIKEISGSNDNSNVNSYWEDKDGNSWVVNKGTFRSEFWYPMLDSFWHPSAKVGDVLPWSFESEGYVSDRKTTYLDFNNTFDVVYNSYWKTDIPELRMGETLTFAGGEEKKDDPSAKGLPSAVAWASAEVVTDTQNSTQSASKWENDYSVKVRPVVRDVKVDFASTDFPKAMEPATKLTTNKGGKWFFE
jgi:hypothetical protein